MSRWHIREVRSPPTVDTLKTIQLFWPFAYVSVQDHSTVLLQMIMHLFYHIVLSSVLVCNIHIKLFGVEDHSTVLVSMTIWIYYIFFLLLMNIHLYWCPDPFNSFRIVWMFYCRGAFICFSVSECSLALVSRTI